ncbi:MAG: hypothetical protein GKS05_10515 [Nitrospirales bacterium]|nr:hypothetical protein [Nitrospirales bacterium]
MAEKFGNFRWIKEGVLDNRVAGFVVGRITFAGIGEVAFCLKGDCKGEISGKAFRFNNSTFSDDAFALERLVDFDAPQLGEVSLISFDPHPLLEPHPYIEWFSQKRTHYRIELALKDAWILTEAEAQFYDDTSNALRTQFSPHFTSASSPPATEDWF